MVSVLFRGVHIALIKRMGFKVIHDLEFPFLVKELKRCWCPSQGHVYYSVTGGEVTGDFYSC